MGARRKNGRVRGAEEREERRRRREVEEVRGERSGQHPLL